MKKKENRVVFLRGKKVILRPFCKETDIKSLTRWINDPEIRDFVVNDLPRMLESEEEWLDDIASGKSPNDIIFAIEASNGKLIGSMGIHRISWKDRSATTGALIGEKEYWGQGYGTAAKMLLLDYAFNSLNMHKISSAVIAYNTRSLDYSLHCGYVIEGRRRKQHFKRGEYHDEIILGLFKDEWLAAQKKYQKIK